MPWPSGSCGRRRLRRRRHGSIVTLRPQRRASRSPSATPRHPSVLGLQQEGCAAPGAVWPRRVSNVPKIRIEPEACPHLCPCQPRTTLEANRGLRRAKVPQSRQLLGCLSPGKDLSKSERSRVRSRRERFGEPMTFVLHPAAPLDPPAGGARLLRARAGRASRPGGCTVSLFAIRANAGGPDSHFVPTPIFLR